MHIQFLVTENGIPPQRVPIFFIYCQCLIPNLCVRVQYLDFVLEIITSFYNPQYMVPIGMHIYISYAKKFKPFNADTVGATLKLSLDTTDEQVRLE